MAFDLSDLTGVEGDRYDIAVMQKFVDLLVGIPKFSYPARRHGPRPDDIDGGYASIDLLEEYQVGIPAKRIKEQNATTTTYLTLSPAKLRFRITFIGTSGAQASMVMHRWEDPVVREFMIDSKYGFADCKPISLESAKLEKEWEHRRAFSVELYTTRIYEEVVDNITGAAVTGKYLTIASATPPRKYVGKPLDINGITPVDPTPIQPMLNKFSNVLTGRERDYDFDSIPDKRLGWSFQDLWHNNWKWNDY